MNPTLLEALLQALEDLLAQCTTNEAKISRLHEVAADADEVASAPATRRLTRQPCGTGPRAPPSRSAGAR